MVSPAPGLLVFLIPGVRCIGGDTGFVARGLLRQGSHLSCMAGRPAGKDEQQ
jgi:hypothetical protein